MPQDSNATTNDFGREPSRAGEAAPAAEQSPVELLEGIRSIGVLLLGTVSIGFTGTVLPWFLGWPLMIQGVFFLVLGYRSILKRR
jgi:hypothetical protein